MKNKIYYFGIAATLLTSGGGLCKIMHWPGAGIMLLVGMIILALVFLPLAFKSSFKAEPNKKLKTLYILAAIILAFDFISMLFKIMHWPSANILVMISIPFPFFVLLPFYLLSNSNDKEINYGNFVAVMFFFVYCAAINSLLTLSVQREIIDGFVKSAYSFEGQASAIIENANLYGNQQKMDVVLNNKYIIENNKIASEATKLCTKIDEVKKMLIINGSGNAPQVLKSNDNTDLWAIKLKDSKPNIELYYITELKNEIEHFKVLLQEKSKQNSELFNYLNDVFDTSKNEFNGESWEKMFLKDKILVSAIEKLNLLQFRIRLASYEVITAVN